MSIRAAFVVKNKFQIAQFANLAAAYENAVYLLMARRSLEKEFSSSDLRSSPTKIRIVDRETVLDAAKEFDVLFFQTVFAGIERITSVPLVSVQYGLAKERHNYGEWRSLADLNLMYGSYSASQVEHFSPSAAVGNLKFAGWDWRAGRANMAYSKSALGLDPSKKSILYMPTYGELGTFDDLVETLGRMTGRYNVMIKMHHNNETNGPTWIDRARAHGIPYLFHGGEDQKQLLAAADLVISDFSGAIFDAIYAEIPVVLYQPNVDHRVGIQKFDLASLEFRRREELGIVVEVPGDLEKAVAFALESTDALVARAASIRSELFAPGPLRAIERAKVLVRSVVDRQLEPLSKQQLYVREAVRRLRFAETALREQERSSPLRRAARLLHEMFLLLNRRVKRKGS